MAPVNQEIVVKSATVGFRGEGKNARLVTIPAGATITVTGYDDLVAKCMWAGWIVYLLKSVIDSGGLPF